MRNVISLAMLLIACDSPGAPAPVWRERATPKTPYEIMLAGLRNTGKARGLSSTIGGIWTLTAEKVEGQHLTTVVLTYLDREGKVNPVVYTARGASIKAKEGKQGVFSVELYQGEADLGSQSVFFQRCERELELAPKR
jgi:hypothetical protein